MATLGQKSWIDLPTIVISESFHCLGPSQIHVKSPPRQLGVLIEMQSWTGDIHPHQLYFMSQLLLELW